MDCWSYVRCSTLHIKQHCILCLECQIQYSDEADHYKQHLFHIKAKPKYTAKMTTTGSCMCGDIKYEYTGEPAVTGKHHFFAIFAQED